MFLALLLSILNGYECNQLYISVELSYSFYKMKTISHTSAVEYYLQLETFQRIIWYFLPEIFNYIEYVSEVPRKVFLVEF